MTEVDLIDFINELLEESIRLNVWLSPAMKTT
jgi:hypothetical protein